MLRLRLPELPPEGSEPALWVFAGDTGQLLDTIAVAGRSALTIDELVPTGSGGPTVDLSVSHPKLWRLVEELAADEQDPYQVAIQLLLVMPELPAALGEPPVPSAHLVLAYRRPGVELPRLEDVSDGYAIWVPVQALDDTKNLEEVAETFRSFDGRRREAEYREDTSLPRLETPRSRRASAGKSARLWDPGISGSWDWRFVKFFVGIGGHENDHGAPFRQCTRRYLGPELTPFFFTKEDRSDSLHELRERRFRPSRSMLDPELTDRDEWLVDRMLNGFHPVLFRRADPDTLFVEHTWDDYDFSDVDLDKKGLAAHEGSKTQYELPNLRAELRREGQTLALSRIVVTYRAGPRLRRATPERPMEHEAPRVFTPDAPIQWSYAKRLLRCQLALTGEMDVHLTRGHLLCEQYLAALETTLGNSDRDHPLYGLLEPYLREVDRINAFGDLLVIGETGALKNGSALSARSIERRFVEQLGGLDWQAFEPRAAVVPSHRYARAASIVWSSIRRFVEEYVNDEVRDSHWEGVHAFSRALTEHSPPYHPHLGLGHGHAEWLDDRELASHGRAPGERSMSRLRTDPAGRVEDLVQLATHAIYHATFVHTWSNDRQHEDLGDPRYASFGLMSRRSPPLDGSPASMEAWEKEADPLLRDAGFQMTVARILTHIDHGHLMSLTDDAPSDDMCLRAQGEPDTAVHPRLRKLLCEQRAALEALNADDPFADGRHERDRIDLRNTRSRINT